MKKFFVKFLLVNFLFVSLFMFFGFSEISNAGSPAKLDSSILSDTDDRIINKKVTGTNLQNSSFINLLIPNLFQLAFYLGSSLAVLSLIYGGYLMITDLGENNRHKKGWKIFGFSIAGLILMLFSRAIVGIVSNIKIADNSVNGIDYGLQGSSNIGNLPSGNIETEVIPQVIQLALQFVFVVVVCIIIYAGIMYISKPEEEKSKMADLFINAVIGLIIIVVSYSLVAGILKINFG